MAKVILEFDTIEDKDELAMTMKGVDCNLALWEISQEVFRPHRKHGYADARIGKAIDDGDALEAISLLEDMFYSILLRREINLDG